MLIETAVLRKSENIQPNLAGEWMRARPDGYALSTYVAVRVGSCGCAPGTMMSTRLRVAILKSVLIKNFNMEVPVSFDPECREAGDSCDDCLLSQANPDRCAWPQCRR